jgi:antitoxin ParD1/3/4
MNVSLTPELKRWVEERVASGQYTSASEVVREALRLFFRYDAAQASEIAQLNERIAEGLAQLDRGEGIAGEKARRQSHARLTARLAAADGKRAKPR